MALKDGDFEFQTRIFTLKWNLFSLLTFTLKFEQNMWESDKKQKSRFMHPILNLQNRNQRCSTLPRQFSSKSCTFSMNRRTTIDCLKTKYLAIHFIHPKSGQVSVQIVESLSTNLYIMYHRWPKREIKQKCIVGTYFTDGMTEQIQARKYICQKQTNQICMVPTVCTVDYVTTSFS